MGNEKPSHIITAQAKRRFKIWLIDNDLTIAKFAKRCGCSRQYISSVLNEKTPVNHSVREMFLKGGYELL